MKEELGAKICYLTDDDSDDKKAKVAKNLS